MSTILVGPKVLRNKAGQLRTHAAAVSTALNHVDSEIRNLNRSLFEGLRAENLRRHYENQRQQLLDIPDLLTGFAQSLEQTAEIFEQADQGSSASSRLDLLNALGHANQHAGQHAGQHADQQFAQQIDALTEQVSAMLTGLPRWSEWGLAAWQALITPVSSTVWDFFARSSDRTPVPDQPPPVPPAQPAAPDPTPPPPDYVRPIDNLTVSQAYKGNLHKGVDFIAPTGVGTPIYSSYVGTVAFEKEVNAGQIQPIYNDDNKLNNPELHDPRVNFGYGNAMIVEYPYADQPPAVQEAWQAAGVQPGQSVYALYAHLDSIDKPSGATVQPGVEIAKMGNDGLSTGPHLHFEVRLGPPDSKQLLGNGWSTLPVANPLHIFELTNG